MVMRWFWNSKSHGRLSGRDLNIEDLISQNGILGKNSTDSTIMMRRLHPAPISILVVLFVMIGVVFVVWAIRLVVLPTNQYERALYRNRLASEIVFAPRGAILDRNDVSIASSTYSQENQRYEREVANIPGIGSLVGFVRYPEKDSSGYYWRFSTEGASGLEQLADAMLKEYPGYRLRTRERSGQVVAVPEDRVVYPRAGSPLKTTLDYELTRTLGNSLSEFILENKYEAGAGAVMNVRTGELLAMISLPDIDPDAMSRGDEGVVESYFADPLKPMLNRVVFGGYSPGSTIKPYLVAAFLNEGIVTPETTVDSDGSIKVINPYTKGEDYTFRDWRPEGHGMTNARWALADSVNTYFYTFGGGYNGRKGLGIKMIKEYMQKFGLGEPVPFVLKGKQPGQVPDPVWKLRTFGETWRLGDTYNSSIGQYGFVVTPLQQLRAVAAIATSGLLIRPVVLPGEDLSVDRISGIEERWYVEVRSGMRDVVTKGSGKSLNVKAIEIAAKTGTPQVANKTKTNSWAIGFWPYDNPQYAFVVLAERGPKEGALGVAHAWRTVVNWMVDERTEYFIPAPGYEKLKASPKKSEQVDEVVEVESPQQDIPEETESVDMSIDTDQIH
jgi:penicillin-binding protein 2